MCKIGGCILCKIDFERNSQWGMIVKHHNITMLRQNNEPLSTCTKYLCPSQSFGAFKDIIGNREQGSNGHCLSKFGMYTHRYLNRLLYSIPLSESRKGEGIY
jgi:hypothetical protein